MIKKSIHSLTIIIGASFLNVTSALAASNIPGRLYFGFGGGSVDYSSANSIATSFDDQLAALLPSVPFSLNTDDTDSGIRVSGGYQINKNLSANFAFTDLGEYVFGGTGVNGTNIVNYKVKADAFAVELGGHYAFPVAYNNNFIPYVKAGLLIWSSKADFTVTSTVNGVATGSGQDSGYDLVYGVGANFFFNDYVGAGIAWDRYDIKDAYDGGGLEIDFLSLSVIVIP